MQNAQWIETKGDASVTLKGNTDVAKRLDTNHIEVTNPHPFVALPIASTYRPKIRVDVWVELETVP